MSFPFHYFRLARVQLIRYSVCLCLLSCLCLPATAQTELTYKQYRDLAWAANRIDHMAIFEPLHGESGMYLAIAERFNTVQIFKVEAQRRSMVWKSVQHSGYPEEIIVADLNGDTLDDALLCRTNAGKIYVWSLEDYGLLWESLSNEFTSITCFTTANVDDDREAEIVLIADGKIVLINGDSFTKVLTSISDYNATMVRCGDVDGDGRVEIVLNTGQVLDSKSAEVEWEDEQFFRRIELLDIDGNGVPEILTENEGTGVLKVFDADLRREVRFQ